MIKPKRLKFKDTIGIVAPAGIFSKNLFFKGVEKIKSAGFNVKFSPKVFDRSGVCAGTAPDRAAQLNEMFADKSVKAIFCAKAGSGTGRIISYLDKEIIRKNPKIIVGYSDITILLTYLNVNCNMVVFHGPIVAGEIFPGMAKDTQEQLFSLLTHGGKDHLLHKDFDYIKEGYAEGLLVGGNLSRIISTLNKKWAIKTEGSILFTEDIDVSLRDVMRMFGQLKSAGKLSRLKGFVFGQIRDRARNPLSKKNLKKIVEKMFPEDNLPVIFGISSGHGKNNLAMPLGVKVSIDTNKRIMLLKESPVS
ncbi:MAG: LD-carboxypeptidase [Candidatus Omnitrophota bacterium]